MNLTKGLIVLNFNCDLNFVRRISKQKIEHFCLFPRNQITTVVTSHHAHANIHWTMSIFFLFKLLKLACTVHTQADTHVWRKRNNGKRKTSNRIWAQRILNNRQIIICGSARLHIQFVQRNTVLYVSTCAAWTFPCTLRIW